MSNLLLDKFFSLFDEKYIEKVEIISDISKLLENIDELIEPDKKNESIDALIAILESHKK